jgi:hypothetical protein
MPHKHNKKGGEVEITIARRAICWNKAQRAPEQAPSAPITVRVEPKLTTPAATAPHAVPRFSRPLTEKEEALIKREFIALNGIFEPLKKDCTRIKNLLGEEVSVFQVSGYVTKLHKLAREGTLELSDRRAYLATLRSHRKHWLTYQGEKYEEMRARIEANGRKPRFAARPEPVTAGAPRHRMAR